MNTQRLSFENMFWILPFWKCLQYCDKKIAFEYLKHAFNVSECYFWHQVLNMVMLCCQVSFSDDFNQIIAITLEQNMIKLEQLKSYSQEHLIFWNYTISKTFTSIFLVCRLRLRHKRRRAVYSLTNEFCYEKCYRWQNCRTSRDDPSLHKVIN